MIKCWPDLMFSEAEENSDNCNDMMTSHIFFLDRNGFQLTDMFYSHYIFEQLTLSVWSISLNVR